MKKTLGYSRLICTPKERLNIYFKENKVTKKEREYIWIEQYFETYIELGSEIPKYDTIQLCLIIYRK